MAKVPGDAEALEFLDRMQQETKDRSASRRSYRHLDVQRERRQLARRWFAGNLVGGVQTCF